MRDRTWLTTSLPHPAAASSPELRPSPFPPALGTAGGLASYAVAASASNPDAALLAFRPAWRKVKAAYDAHFAAMEAAYDRYEATRPALPEVLIERPSDRAMNLPMAHWDSVNRGWPGGSPCFFTDSNVQTMTRELKRGAWTGEKRERAEEIVTAFGSWHKADRAALEASGYSDDSPEEDDVTERHAEAVWEIAREPARTMAGLLFKAEVALSVACRNGDPETALIDAAESDGLSKGMVALFIVRDLLRLGAEAAHG